MIPVIAHLLADALANELILVLGIEAKGATPAAAPIFGSLIVSHALWANTVAENGDFIVLQRAVFVGNLVVDGLFRVNIDLFLHLGSACLVLFGLRFPIFALIEGAISC